MTLPTETAPILFLVFNRPDTTARVFDAIRAARPRQLFIAADGPRAHRAGEAERCQRAREIATAVDWPCETRTLFRQDNLGCKRAVSSAIDWFFDQVAEGIVLEDDCVPDPSFFAYCGDLLARYRNDSRVMAISGDNFISAHWRPQESYYFSLFPHIWGWATWRRAWRHYDVQMTDWRADPQRGDALLRSLFPGSKASQRFWRRQFDAVADGRIDTWDYQWVHACWSHGGLSSLPRTNLIANIGFGANATHTLNAESKMADLPVGELALPLDHPAEIVIAEAADRWSCEHVFGIDERPRAGRWVRRCAGYLRRRLQGALEAKA